MTGRRGFLRSATGVALAAWSRPRAALAHLAPPFLPGPIPRVNGGINIQPLRRLELDAGDTPPLIVPALVDLQMRALYELGFERIRITLSWHRFGPDFLAAIPYVRAARALGMDVIGLAADFSGFDFAVALSQNSLRGPLLRAFALLFAGPLAPAGGVQRPGAFAFQILNEPVQSIGVSPGNYVRRFLAPAYQALKLADPAVVVVSAAEVGTRDGILRQRAMFESGLEDFCDKVAYHVYDRQIIGRLAGMAQKPVLVTESGFDGTAGHLAWVEEVFPEIRRTLAGVEEVFYFQLFDREPGRHRLLDVVQDPDGTVRAVVESQALVARYAARVAAASGDAPRAAYRDLVPDITLYFPTAEDMEIIDSVPAFVLP